MQQLEQYDSTLKQTSISKDETLRVFHGLKSIYIQAIIANDVSLKKETLERLVKTSKMLNIDGSKYEAELSALAKDGGAKKANTSSSKPMVPPPATEENLNEPPVSTSSSSSSSSSVSQPTRQPISEPVKETPVFKNTTESRPITSNTVNATTVSSLPQTYRGKNVLQSISTKDDEVILNFGSDIPEKEIKSFVLKSDNSYKKMIDVPGVILNAPLAIKTPQKLQALKVSQNGDGVIRVVLDADQSLDTYISVLTHQLIISLGKKPILTQQRIQAPQPPVQQPVQQTKTPPPPAVPDVSHVKNEPTASITPTVLAPTTKSKKGLKRDKLIVIDAGHGGKDVGAIGFQQRTEKTLVLELALQLGKELRERGYRVLFTRQSDEFINLRDRTKIANEKNADFFISVHANAAPTEAKRATMKGLETFFLSPGRSERAKNAAALENQSDMEEMNFYSKETFLNVLNREKIVLSNKAAIDIQSNMLKSVRKKSAVDDGGVREAPFWVLVGAMMPAVLVEVGYITHPDESNNMFTPAYQKLLVQGIADGLDQYFTNNP